MKAKPKPKSSTSSLEEQPGSSSPTSPNSTTKDGKVKRHKWRPWEKEGFIKAFQKASADQWLGKGPPDRKFCEKILRSFEDPPGMEAGHIGRFINNIVEKVKRQRSATETALEKWLEVIDALSAEEQDLETQLSLVMLVAKQEPADGTPLPATFKPDMPRPDFEAIYEYFSCAFRNRPLPELSPIDSLVVEDCMQSLTYQIECLNDDELRRSLRKVFLHMVQDPNEEYEHDHEEMRKNLVHNATALNPLGLNAQAIVPVVPE